MGNSADLNDDFNRLGTAVLELLNFRLIHESRLIATEEAMADMYPMETLQWNQENNPEYEEYLETPPLDFLFQQTEDKEKFMANFQQAIKTHIFQY